MDRFDAHLDRAWDLVLKGETTKALVAARHALDLDGDSPEVHNLIGYILTVDGDFDEALECYRRAIDLDEWYFDALLNAAEVLGRPNADPDEAIRLCRQAGEVAVSDEESADAVLVEVDALLNAGRREEAATRLRAIDPGAPFDSAHRVAMGRAMLDCGDLEAAAEQVERAIEQDGSSADGWHLLGFIAREEGRRIDSVAAFAKVRRLDVEAPRPPWAMDDGRIEREVVAAIGRMPEEARSAFDGVRIAIEDYPSEDDVRREIDPRQAVRAEGVDPERRSFEVLRVFARNLDGVSPTSIGDELSVLLSGEAGLDAHDLAAT